MRLTAARRALLFAAVATLLWLAFPPGAAAEQLPVKVYTVENGLAHNRIKHIVQDSRGFLWFCTADGLSRFDGSQFVNYQLDDGLLAPSINDLVEAGDGTYWIATNSDGVFRFDPRVAATGAHAGVSRFTRAAVGAEPVSNRVNVLLRDSRRDDLGRHRRRPLRARRAPRGGRLQSVPLRLPGRPDIQVAIWTFVRDRSGALWIGTKYGLVRRSAGGAMHAIPVRPGPDDDNVVAVIRGADGRLWIGHREGLFSLDPAASDPVLRRYTTSDGLESDNIIALHSSPDGRIWIKTFGTGITEFDGTSFRTYGSARAA
jgi:ligand-binding sensor domain-containing protein